MQTKVTEKSDGIPGNNGVTNINPPTNSSSLTYIKRYPLFAPLPLVTQERLVALLQQEQRSAGETIFSYSDPGDTMYFLCAGSVRFITRDNIGTEVILEETKEGDLFGEVALYTEGRRSADAVAVTDSVLLTLHRDRLNDFLRACPEVSQYLLQRMASRLASSNKLLRNARNPVDDVVAAERSPQDRMVKKIVDTFATLPCLIVHMFIICLWIALKRLFNSPLMQFESVDLLILSLIINVEGFAVSMLILVNQARESKEEGVRDRTEFDATLHADAAISHLHEKVDALAAELRRFHIEHSAHHNGNGHNSAP